MKPVRIHHALLKQIRTKPDDLRKEIGERIAEVQRCMGFPHLHKGLGLRNLKDDYYEVRIGLKLRLVFENVQDALVFEMMGSHDEVRRFLKSF